MMMVIGKVPDLVGSEVLESASFQCTVCEGGILEPIPRLLGNLEIVSTVTLFPWCVFLKPLNVQFCAQILIGGCHRTSWPNQILFYAVRCLE